MAKFDRLVAPTGNQDIQNLLSAISFDLGLPIRTSIGFTSPILENYDDYLSANEMKWLGLDFNDNTIAECMLKSLPIFSHLMSEDRESEEIDLNLLLTRIARTTGVSFKIDKLPCIRGCRNHWLQVFTELTRNSLAFQTSGKDCQIKIHCIYTQSGDCLVKFEDNGPGIPSAFYEDVLLPFAKIDTSSPRSGMGLSYCNCIITQHGGHLNLSPSAAGGISVNIHLPPNIIIAVQEN